ncbi:hypothetical protein [Haloarcula amylovorans]|uniref:hypothetical protein n=1 Tax=Haloarcula amylovorans TaxID=2562280 RepID=UPI001431A4DE|nr:hypothetical protein [Halomicroarcula amylolytica]
MSEYLFRARCGICKTSSEWVESADDAREWRLDHFDSEHPDNPMATENCAIQRYPVDEIAMTDGGQSADDIEQLAYAGWAEDRSERKTVTITAVASDDEGLTEIDKEAMEIEMPARGCLKLEIDGEEISLEPNSLDGNPRVER